MSPLKSWTSLEWVNRQEVSKRAVESGYWLLYDTIRPSEKERQNPFVLDSKEPQWDRFNGIFDGGGPLSIARREFPAVAEDLFKAAEENARWRFNTFRRLALWLFERTVFTET